MSELQELTDSDAEPAPPTAEELKKKEEIKEARRQLNCPCEIDEDCTDEAEGVCKAIYCCIDFGCGRDMCSVHEGMKCNVPRYIRKSKKKWKRINQYTCTECNDKTHIIGIVFTVLVWSFFLSFLVGIPLFGYY